MTIWLNAHRSLCGLLPPLVKYISDRRYFSIVLGIVPQLRYNYKFYRPRYIKLDSI
ncbi:hypothetical protein QUA74_04835 [Microcoleus sp. LAD1_D3]|uniref:hypothetical protein n=1 Tax=Microcoleus sp. LAD1_D3 TaxID=2819365 RepID=UPI002FD0B159